MQLLLALTMFILGVHPQEDRLGMLSPKAMEMSERENQIPAIVRVFERRTDPVRARWLASVCFLQTRDTVFMPMDLAEIALVETGGFKLSATAVSSEGARGVWQLMPHRAKVHGFTTRDLRDDEKCAAAAVKELTEKLQVSHGNLKQAKRLYCGTGIQARIYERRRMQFRHEIVSQINQRSYK